MTDHQAEPDNMLLNPYIHGGVGSEEDTDDGVDWSDQSIIVTDYGNRQAADEQRTEPPGPPTSRDNG